MIHLSQREIKLKRFLTSSKIIRLAISYDEATKEYVENWPRVNVKYNNKIYKLDGIGWNESDSGNMIETIILTSPNERLTVGDLENVELLNGGK